MTTGEEALKEVHRVELELTKSLNEKHLEQTKVMNDSLQGIEGRIGEFVSNQSLERQTNETFRKGVEKEITGLCGLMSKQNKVLVGNGDEGLVDRVDTLEEFKEEVDGQADTRSKFLLKMLLGVWTTLLGIGSTAFLYYVIG